MEGASITCYIAQKDGKFWLVANVTEMGYFTMSTYPEAVTMTPLTEKDIREVYPLGLLPD